MRNNVRCYSHLVQIFAVLAGVGSVGCGASDKLAPNQDPPTYAAEATCGDAVEVGVATVNVKFSNDAPMQTFVDWIRQARPETSLIATQEVEPDSLQEKLGSPWLHTGRLFYRVDRLELVRNIGKYGTCSNLAIFRKDGIDFAFISGGVAEGHCVKGEHIEQQVKGLLDFISINTPAGMTRIVGIDLNAVPRENGAYDQMVDAGYSNGGLVHHTDYIFWQRDGYKPGWRCSFADGPKAGPMLGPKDVSDHDPIYATVRIYGDKILPPPIPPTWEPLGGTLTSSPAVSSWGPGRFDVFVRGADDKLWHRWYDGAWSNWESLGGWLTSDPAAVSWSAGRIDVFVRGGDDCLWHKWYQGGWSNWESLGGKLTSGPAASSWAPGRLDVFVRGTDNALWHRWFEVGWSPRWESLGGYLTSGPAAVSVARNQIDVFVAGGDYALYHRWYFSDWGGWSASWERLGGILTSSPAAASWAPDRRDILVRGGDFALWHIAYQYPSGWSSWESFGGYLTSSPAVVSWGPQRLDYFMRGADNGLWHGFSD